jgi:hypothetical protein
MRTRPRTATTQPDGCAVSVLRSVTFKSINLDYEYVFVLSRFFFLVSIYRFVILFFPLLFVRVYASSKGDGLNQNSS